MLLESLNDLWNNNPIYADSRAYDAADYVAQLLIHEIEKDLTNVAS